MNTAQTTQQPTKQPTPRQTARPALRLNGHPERRNGPEQALLRPTCALCNGAVYRVPRHLSDRLLSLFRPVLRYCCFSPRCGWEGTLRFVPPDPRALSIPDGRFDDHHRHPLLEPSRNQPGSGASTGR